MWRHTVINVHAIAVACQRIIVIVRVTLSALLHRRVLQMEPLLLVHFGQRKHGDCLVEGDGSISITVVTGGEFLGPWLRMTQVDVVGRLSAADLALPRFHAVVGKLVVLQAALGLERLETNLQSAETINYQRMMGCYTLCLSYRGLSKHHGRGQVQIPLGTVVLKYTFITYLLDVLDVSEIQSTCTWTKLLDKYQVLSKYVRSTFQVLFIASTFHCKYFSLQVLFISSTFRFKYFASQLLSMSSTFHFKYFSFQVSTSHFKLFSNTF